MFTTSTFLCSKVLAYSANRFAFYLGKISTLSPLQLRHEKIDLENTLEQEQEALVNRLWKRMDKLEAEKR